ncbi:hypothetical protein RJ55_05685 [Drechmeria coniospora]|nr:hypothetical protein RJ55_05685 [Drechmeria coniospora]
MMFTTASALALASMALAGPCQMKAATPTDSGWETRYTATGAADVAAAAATAKTSSPTSHVKGKAFDRLAIIYFENQNYDKSYGDPNFEWFSNKGITLTNYYAVTHPSQPNYLASIAGDYFGMRKDGFDRVPRNVSTVIDLLESRGISWGLYQEDMPFSGFEGKSYKNQEDGSNDYVRKHNPAVLHDSITYREQGLSQIKNLSMIDTSRSMFHKDLEANTLPQWMFITPNMTSDGHDSSITTAGEWCRSFLEPLLTDKRFMDNTLVLITWDESETYKRRNNVLGILLGDAVPEDLVATYDENFYNHYSQIATVSANWGLPTLGRWDVGANVFEWVAERTGDKLREWSSEKRFRDMLWNYSYAGFFNPGEGNKQFPAPNMKLDKSVNGRPILQSIKDKWARSTAPTYYEDTIEVPDGFHPPEGYEPDYENDVP